jgi:predicted HicB family RNase H-like nuclease
MITFQGASVSELKKAFRGSIDDYLAFCKQRGETPEKPFPGQFVTRISPELHRRVNVAALMAGMSLNAWVTDQIQAALADNDPRVGAKRKKGSKKAG